MSDAPGIVPLDCVKCGACCLQRAWNQGGFPFLELEGEAELQKIEALLPKRYKLEDDDRPYCDTALMPLKNVSRGCGSCVFLSGVPGEEVACKIYRDRPGVCERFVPGGEGCLRVRRDVFGRDRLPEDERTPKSK